MDELEQDFMRQIRFSATQAMIVNILSKCWEVGIRDGEAVILTVDQEEVVGCSEWMQGGEFFQHIVDLHNAWLGKTV